MTDNNTYAEPWPLPPLETVLADLRDRGITLPEGNKCVGAFGDSPELSNELLALIRDGNKRGGACLLWTYEALGEALPLVGDIEIVLDHLNQPVLVTRTVRVESKPFAEVGADFAAVEAEGDGSLEFWRREHWKCFTRDCARLGREPAESMMVICVTFDLLAKLDVPSRP